MVYNNNSPYLEYDLDEIISNCYEIEVTKKIADLSRQIRTLMNYKFIIIRIRFQHKKTPTYLTQNQKFLQEKKKFEKHTEYLIQILKKIKIDKERIRYYENHKDLRSIIKELFIKIHYFSEQPNLINIEFLHLIIKVIQEIYEILIIFNLQFNEFYLEIKSNYVLLDKEIEHLIQTNKSRDKKLLDSQSTEVLSI